MEDNQILKNYIREKRYNECISLLEKKIINFVINKIKEKDSTISFTTISDLISASDFFLKDSSIAYSLSLALDENMPISKIENLLQICEEYDIK